MFFQIRSIKSEVFTWLSEIQNSLTHATNKTIEERSPEPPSMKKDSDEEEESTNYFDAGVPSRISFENMRELIMENIVDFVQMDPIKTIKICEHWFDSDFLRIADSLKDHKDLAFSFLNTVLTQNEESIINTHN